MSKARFVVHRLDAVVGDSYWDSRHGRWVSELDGGYTTYGFEKIAIRVAAKRSNVGWSGVDVVQDPAQKFAEQKAFVQLLVDKGGVPHV